MAGGEGRRLLPVTANRPKPMAELGGRPILEYTLRTLRDLGFEEVTLTLRYLPEVITDWFGTGARLGMKLTYSLEDRPLGTAGGVRKAVGDPAEEVLVLSGDGIFTFDLGQLMEFYRKTGADAVMALYRTDRPTSFGTVNTDGEGRILAFSEKPRWSQVTADSVNTGIYILSPRALLAIPGGRSWDFGRDHFPMLLGRGYDLRGLVMDGQWRDLGTPAELNRARRDAAAGRLKLPLEPMAEQEHEGAQVSPEALICRDCKIGPGAEIGPGAVLADGVTVGAGAKIAAGTKIWPGIRVPEGASVTGLVRHQGDLEPAVMRGSEAVGPIRGALGPEKLLGMGARLGEGGRCAVGWYSQDCEAAARLFACGVRFGGGDAILTDAPFEAAMSWFCAQRHASSGAFFRREGDMLRVSFFGPEGTQAGAETVGSLVRASGCPTGERTGQLVFQTGTGRAYLAACAVGRASRIGLPEVSVTVRGPEGRALKQVLVLTGCSLDFPGPGVPGFRASEGGYRLEAEDETGEEISSDRLLWAALLEAGERDGALCLPEGVPVSVRRLLQSRGVSLLPGGGLGADVYGRHFDGAYCAALIADAMGCRSVSLRELMEAVPSPTVLHEVFTSGLPAAFALGRLAAYPEMALEPAAGLVLGSARVRATEDGTGLEVAAEGESEAQARSSLDRMRAAIRALEEEKNRQ